MLTVMNLHVVHINYSPVELLFSMYSKTFTFYSSERKKKIGKRHYSKAYKSIFLDSFIKGI